MEPKTTELQRVLPVNVFVTESFFEPAALDQNILFALLDKCDLHVRAVTKLDGVALPLSRTIYKLGKILPKPSASSILLYRLCESVPVPKTKKMT